MKLLKKLSVILSCIFMTIQLAGCGNTVQTETHEHTFSSAWEYNELLHWHKATCNHTELTKNLGVHEYDEDGKCKICDYEDENHPQEPQTHVNEYYLPLESNEYVDDDLQVKTTYEYTNDLHGFTETKLNYVDGYENYFKDVNRFSFNEDYSKLTLIMQEYDVTPQTEKLTRQSKYEYEFYENNSYKVRLDDYDVHENEYVFQNVTGKFYNERGQKTLEYKIKSGEEADTFYFADIYKYFYNEDGFIEKEIYYGGSYSGDKITYLESFNLYEYNEDYTNMTEKAYYYSPNGYFEDGYAETSAEIIDEIRYETQVIYDRDGNKGNTNKYGYDKNFERVYVYYGGIPEKKEIVKNEYNQIVRYSGNGGFWETEMTANYAENGGPLLSTEKDEDNGTATYHEKSEFTYNEYKQLVKATKTVTGDYEYFAKNEITYTEYQNDELLKHIDLYNSIIRYFTDNALVEGI